MEKRIISTEYIEEDHRIENSLRPKLLSEYIGQEKAKETLKVYIEAGKKAVMNHWSMCCFTSSRTWKNNACRDYSQ